MMRNEYGGRGEYGGGLRERERGRSYGRAPEFEMDRDPSSRPHGRDGGAGEWSARDRGDAMMRERSMDGAPIVKVIEVLAQSPHSWEDAARRAVAEASRTVRDIRSIYVKEMQAIVDDDHIVSFRINAKVSFAIDDRVRREHGQRSA